MARSVLLNFPHDLGADKAKQLVAQRLDSLRAQFGDKIGSSEIVWTGHNAHIEVSALAQNASGDVAVTDDNVRIQIELPWLLSPLSGKINAFLTNVADEALRNR